MFEKIQINTFGRNSQKEKGKPWVDMVGIKGESIYAGWPL